MGILGKPDPAAPLGQGDVLRAPLLYRSDTDSQPVTPKKTPPYVLVLSRNCKALRAKLIVVCPIFPQRLSDLGSTYKAAKVQLEAIRDGSRPKYRDRFYLGALDDTNHRCAAHLDEIYTLDVPERDDQRRRFIEDQRVWSLDSDFQYDLHARLFISFARRGFDDVSWYSDRDLDYLTTLAEAELDGASSALKAARAESNRLQGDCDTKQQKLIQLDKQIANKAAEVASLRAELQPLRAESDRRKHTAGTRTQD